MIPPLLVGIAICVVLIGLGSREQKHRAAADDKFYTDLLRQSPMTAEARAWLARSDGYDRTIGKDDPIYTHAESVELVDALYAAGAVKVYAINIDSEPDSRYEGTRTLIVRLPSDPKQRRKLFQIEAKSALRDGFDRDPDNGRRYMMFFWD